MTAAGAPPERTDPDVLVVGAGVVGLFCAYFLAQAGRSVTVVDRFAVGDPRSCSCANSGFVGTQGAAPLAEPGALAQALRTLLRPDSRFAITPRLDSELLAWVWHFRRSCTEPDARAAFRVLLELKQRSLAILRELCASGGLAPLFAEPGLVVAFTSPQGFARACRSMPQAEAAGVPLRILGSTELKALEPDVEFAISGALYNEEGAYLHVPDFVLELARTVESLGVEIYPYTEVIGLDAAGEVVQRVATSRGDFRPREVVMAAGAWSAQCVRSLGVRLVLQPAKGYSITVATPRHAPTRPVLLAEAKVALAPLGDQLRLAGTLQLAGFDAGVSQRRVDGILRTVRQHLPQLTPTEPMQVWSGLRPCTPDSLPYLGRALPYRNLTLAAGHGHIGMGLAPVGGRLIAQIVTGAVPELDLAPFRIHRFGRRRS